MQMALGQRQRTGIGANPELDVLEERGKGEEMKEVNEFYCHACNGYFRVELEMGLNGNHVVECPNCGHEHCRVIEGGRITADRWDQRNGLGAISYTVTMSDYSATSAYSGTGDSFIASSWVNTSASATTMTIYGY
jgi:hypothetical protein